MLYYFSGFLGYVVLANYIKRFHIQPRAWNYPVGLALIIVGYAITVFGFLHRLPTEKFVNTLEFTWSFETINVAMVTAGIFIMATNIRISNITSPLGKIVLDISAKSYGIYLSHIMLLNVFHSLIDKQFNTSVIKIPLIAIGTFITTFLVIKLLSCLPKSKCLIG